MYSESEGSGGESAGEKAEELKDPMSGYTSADALDTQAKVDEEKGNHVHADELKDSMSGYASADEIAPRTKVDAEGTDKIHTEEMKDSMSGYASADALDADEK